MALHFLRKNPEFIKEIKKSMSFPYRDVLPRSEQDWKARVAEQKYEYGEGSSNLPTPSTQTQNAFKCGQKHKLAFKGGYFFRFKEGQGWELIRQYGKEKNDKGELVPVVLDGFTAAEIQCIKTAVNTAKKPNEKFKMTVAGIPFAIIVCPNVESKNPLEKDSVFYVRSELWTKIMSQHKEREQRMKKQLRTNTAAAEESKRAAEEANRAAFTMVQGTPSSPVTRGSPDFTGQKLFDDSSDDDSVPLGPRNPGKLNIELQKREDLYNSIVKNKTAPLDGLPGRGAGSGDEPVSAQSDPRSPGSLKINPATSGLLHQSTSPLYDPDTPSRHHYAPFMPLHHERDERKDTYYSPNSPMVGAQTSKLAGDTSPMMGSHTPTSPLYDPSTPTNPPGNIDNSKIKLDSDAPPHQHAQGEFLQGLSPMAGAETPVSVNSFSPRSPLYDPDHPPGSPSQQSEEEKKDRDTVKLVQDDLQRFKQLLNGYEHGHINPNTLNNMIKAIELVLDNAPTISNYEFAHEADVLLEQLDKIKKKNSARIAREEARRARGRARAEERKRARRRTSQTPYQDPPGAAKNLKRRRHNELPF